MKPNVLLTTVVAVLRMLITFSLSVLAAVIMQLRLCAMLAVLKMQLTFSLSVSAG